MRGFKRITVGIDLNAEGEGLSPGSAVAAEQALWLAQRTGARVDFLHSTGLNPEQVEPPRAEQLGEVDAQIGALRTKYDVTSGLAPVALVEERPWVALTRRVLSGETDLVVVAKRSQAKRDDRRLGSVSMQLIRNCPAPVWVVKPEHDLRHRYVLAASDLSDVGDLATEYAASIAQAEECTLGVAHAWQVPIDLQLSAARLGHDETARQKRELAEAAREHVGRLACVKELGDQAEIHVACDSPSNLVLRLAEEKDPDLVVMGTVSRGGIAGLLVGNTAEKLLYRLESSLLTIKPDGFVCPIAP